MHTLQIAFSNADQRVAEEIEKHAEHSWFSFHSGNRRLAMRKAQYHLVCSDTNNDVALKDEQLTSTRDGTGVPC
jgi:hypothetical protein